MPLASDPGSPVPSVSWQQQEWLSAKKKKSFIVHVCGADFKELFGLRIALDAADRFRDVAHDIIEKLADPDVCGEDKYGTGSITSFIDSNWCTVPFESAVGCLFTSGSKIWQTDFVRAGAVRRRLRHRGLPARRGSAGGQPYKCRRRHAQRQRRCRDVLVGADNCLELCVLPFPPCVCLSLRGAECLSVLLSLVCMLQKCSQCDPGNLPEVTISKKSLAYAEKELGFKKRYVLKQRYSEHYDRHHAASPVKAALKERRRRHSLHV
eukprot:SAG22_NODE_673_length_7973_cov_3.643129_5_plen_265_part_00